MMPAPANAAGQWAAECGWSHQGQYDPTVFPGQPGMSHLHEFFGLRDVTSTLGVRQIESALRNPEKHTCLLAGDGSSYWAPALYQNGRHIQPSTAFAYYKSPPAAGFIEPYPIGLEMIAKVAPANSPQVKNITWYCDWDSTNSGPLQNPPPCGLIEPRGQPGGSTLRDQLRLEIRFPSCWNGRLALGSVIYPAQGHCPNAYRRLLPELQLNIMYPVRFPASGLSLASGSIITAHADFVNGWPVKLQRQLINKCLNAGRDCGRLSNRGRQKALNPSKPILGQQIRSLLLAGI